MSNFAELDEDGYVINVLQISDEFDDDYLNYINNVCGISGHFVPAKPTSYNWAAQGMKYYADVNAFLSDSPYPSWQISSNDHGAFFWTPPVPYPTDENKNLISGYVWDEASPQWVLFE